MAKTKKNTIASIMRAMDVNQNQKETLIIGEGENQVNIVVKKRLSLLERADMVSSIVSMVWAQTENDNEEFAPYLRKFACDFNILNYFTNISLPSDMEKVWEFVDSTDITNMIVEFVGNNYIKDILREANEAIEYRKEEVLKRSKLDKLLDSISGFAKSFADKADGLDIGGFINIIGEFAPELKDEINSLLNNQIAEAIKTPEDASAV